MGIKGKRKYVCADCKNEFFIRIQQTYKRTRERCPQCGSIRIDLSGHSLGNDEILSANEVLARRGDGFAKARTRKL